MEDRGTLPRCGRAGHIAACPRASRSRRPAPQAGRGCARGEGQLRVHHHDRIAVRDGSAAAASAGTSTKGLLMAFKLLEMAQRRWHRLNGAHLLPLVRAGVRFVDGPPQASGETETEARTAAPVASAGRPCSCSSSEEPQRRDHRNHDRDTGHDQPPDQARLDLCLVSLQQPLHVGKTAASSVGRGLFLGRDTCSGRSGSATVTFQNDACRPLGRRWRRPAKSGPRGVRSPLEALTIAAGS